MHNQSGIPFIGLLLQQAIPHLEGTTGVLRERYRKGVQLSHEGGQWLFRGGRCVWQGDTRIHIAVREPTERTAALLADRLQIALEAVPGVVWARFHAPLRYAVVETDPSARRGHGLDRLTHVLVAKVAGVEAELRLDERPFAARMQPEHHPGDAAPILLSLLEGAMDFTSGVASLGIRQLGLPAPPLNLELMAIVESVADIPLVRKAVERKLSIMATDVWLEVAAAILRPLVRGDLSGAAGLVHRYLRLRELWARRAAWCCWEPRLCGDPDALKETRFAPRDTRPVPFPDGILERSATRLALGTFSAFSGVWFASGRLAPATAAIFAGLPRPARMGRDAFASQLGYRLARAGVLVLEPHVLRRFDRMDCVALDAQLAGIGTPDLERLITTINRAGLQLVWVGAGRRPASMRHHGRRFTSMPANALRRLQREGRGVIYIGCDGRGLATADCGISFRLGQRMPAATAHILAPGGLEQAMALVQAVAAAHRASRESVSLSTLKIALAVALASTGLNRATTQRVLSAAGLTSVLAMVDGIRLANAIALPGEDLTAVAPAGRAWHRMTHGEVLAALGSSVDGISDAEASQRQLPPPRQRSALAEFSRFIGEELDSPLTPVLAVGAALSFLTGAPIDAAMISSVILFNALYGGVQRFRTDALIRQLSKRELQRVSVRRASALASVVETALVPGDVIELSAGEAVPADCRIMAATGLEVDEASLTGESLPVTKKAAPCDAADIAGRRSMLYAGTYIVSGDVTAVVTSVGASTESGRAARLAADAWVSTGVEKRLRSLTAYTAPVAATAGVLVAIAGRLRGQPVHETLATGVSLSVAAVPEGLPVLAGLAQSSVAGRLSARGTLVRDPRALEALGRMNVLCADKTGTLTEGRLRLREVSDGRDIRPLARLTARHERVIAVALRASPSTSNGAPTPHPTDQALIGAAQSAGVSSHDVHSRWVRLDELPFEPGRAYQAGLAELDGDMLISVKGAPEVLLPRCTHRATGMRRRRLSDVDRERLHENAGALARRGYRVLAVAERRAHERRSVESGRVSGLTLIGFLAFADPPRTAARTAVARLQRAGVDVVMLTGDHPDTAAAIAGELGVGDGKQVITGAQLDAMSDARLAAAVGQANVFARVTPAHKVRIVKALQQCGRVVGMTGDGANDAQAIRLADVGIALGERSTAAARAAADLVVTDSRIETIVDVVMEGRSLWVSVRDAVSLLIGGNLGEVLFTLAGALAGKRSPLNARQLLLLNLVSDTAPALALALRPPQRSAQDLLTQGPETSLGGSLKADIALRAGITAGTATLAWAAARLSGKRGASAGTVALLGLTGVQLAQTLLAGRGSRVVNWTTVGTLAGLVAAVQTPGVSRLFGSRPQGPLGLLQAAAATAAGTAAYTVLPRLDRLWRRQRDPVGTDP